MEFHDSTFEGLDRDGADLTQRFSAAYIYESEGEPGLDAVRMVSGGLTSLRECLHKRIYGLSCLATYGMVRFH